MLSRRRFLSGASALAGTMLLDRSGQWSAAHAASPVAILKRPIPSSGERVPVIGMGTSSSFEVAAGSSEYQALKEVLKRFVAGGATLIDTAPTYSNAEDILGALLRESGVRARTFIATKLSGVRGRDSGLEQFRSTLQRLGTDKVELLQVHNLRDWQTQLEVARQLKAEGKVKYVGLTHFVDRAHEELAAAVQEAKPDFLQINYSVTQRGAEQRVFPVANSSAWRCSPTATSMTAHCSIASKASHCPAGPPKPASRPGRRCS